MTLLLTGCPHVTSRTPASRVFDAANSSISNARGLLPPGRHSYDVVLVDRDLSGDSVAIRRLDAFTVIETDGSRRRRIYINRESSISSRPAAAQIST